MTHETSDQPENLDMYRDDCYIDSLQVSGSQDEWACPECTLINSCEFSACDACYFPRPESRWFPMRTSSDGDRPTQNDNDSLLAATRLIKESPQAELDLTGVSFAK